MIPYVHAVANQVQTRLVPPAAKAGNTVLPGSLRMSGQSNVEDRTVAEAANARAPATNSPPVVRRSRASVPVAVVSIVMICLPPKVVRVCRPVPPIVRGHPDTSLTRGVGAGTVGVSEVSAPASTLGA
jgi:hypothetical protein